MTCPQSDRIDNDSALQSTGSQAAWRADMAMKRVLLVDDQAHVLRVVKLSLDRHGYEVDTALDAATALNMFREAPYDVVISSSHMPDVSGAQLSTMLLEEFASNGPLLLVVDNAAGSCETSLTLHDQRRAGEVSTHDGFELVDGPLSLRWLVLRLSEHFAPRD